LNRRHANTNLVASKLTKWVTELLLRDKNNTRTLEELFNNPTRQDQEPRYLAGEDDWFSNSLIHELTISME
jgi:hypothetical protein